MNYKPFLLLIILSLFLVHSSVVFAGEDYDLVVVNSNNWVDVYNSLLYGSLSHTKVLFLSDQSQTNLFFSEIDSSMHSILLVESNSRLSPVANKILSSLGYDVEILSLDDTSLFFESLLNVDSYVLVDKNFPLNGLSVASYAIASHSWVFFVDKTLNPQVLLTLKNKDVLSYGRVPFSILQDASPSLIIDKGNKYKNSVEMAKIFLDLFPTQQFILTEGSFLEPEFFGGSYPVLIIGISLAPKSIEDFFVESSVSAAVVVGQASIPSATNLKHLLESSYDKKMKFIAKLGKTSSDPTRINEILPLNMFPLPSPKIKLNIDSAFYNQITRQLEVRFSNEGDVFLSYAPSVVISQDGKTSVLDPVDEEYFLETSESRTIQFPVDLESTSSVSAKITVSYGESSDSFDLSASKEFSPLDFLSVVDNSVVLIKKIVYDEKNKVFLISVYNNGSTSAYVDIDLIDVIVQGDLESFSSSRAIFLEAGKTSTMVIYAVLSSVDLLANPFVLSDMSYGQRDYALIHTSSNNVPLSKKSFFSGAGLIIGAAVFILLAFILFFLFSKKHTYVCLHCGYVHKSKPKRCISCGFGRFKKS